MALTNSQFDYAISSTLNYTELMHGNEVQDYFVPIYEAVDNPAIQRIAVKACHAVGKTFNFARIIEALMSRYNHIKVISTAPTFRQVHDLLWKEIHSAHESKPSTYRRGTLNQVEWWVNSETFARGFSPQKKAKSETGQGTDSVFQGYHAKYLTVVVFDEATGIEPQIWEQAEGLLTSGQRVLFLVIANPTSRNCRFFDCFNNRSWKTFSITCFDSPNLIASNIRNLDDILKEVEIISRLDDDEALARLSSYPCPKPYLINTRWVIEKAIEWGVDHPLFLGKVLGEFPTVDENIIISAEDVKISQSRALELSEQGNVGFVGLDVARFGVDKSVLTSFVGYIQAGLKQMVKNDTNEVVGHTINFIEALYKEYPQLKSIRLAVDGGFGHGVIDGLKEKKQDQSDKRIFNILKNVTILEINFGSSDWVKKHFGWVDEISAKRLSEERKVQEDRENYSNFKANMFDLLGRDIRTVLQLLNNDIYSKQLPKILKQVDSKGRLKIESKEDFKNRTGETSPDEADSIALANFARYFFVKKMSVAQAMKLKK